MKKSSGKWKKGVKLVRGSIFKVTPCRGINQKWPSDANHFLPLILTAYKLKIDWSALNSNCTFVSQLLGWGQTLYLLSIVHYFAKSPSIEHPIKAERIFRYKNRAQSKEIH